MNEKFGLENNIVTVDEDGFHRMDYEKIVVPMVRAVQELSAELERKQHQLDRYEAAMGFQARELQQVKVHLETLLAENEADAGLVRSRHASAFADPMLWLLGAALAALVVVLRQKRRA